MRDILYNAIGNTNLTPIRSLALEINECVSDNLIEIPPHYLIEFLENGLNGDEDVVDIFKEAIAYLVDHENLRRKILRKINGNTLEIYSQFGDYLKEIYTSLLNEKIPKRFEILKKI